MTCMPRLSDSMEEGTILTWLKSVGDPVAVGEELVEIETDKANMVYESDAAGTLVEIVAAEGETLPIGEVIARVGEAGEAAAGDGGGRRERPRRRHGQEPAPERVAAAEPAPSPAPSAAEPRRGRGRRAGQGLAAGAADRRRARDRPREPLGLRPRRADHQGRRRGGRGIARRPPPAAPAPGPVAAAAATAAPSPETAKGRVEIVEPTKLQQTIARRMAESKATAPHFYLRAEVDMSAGGRGALAAEGRGRARATSSPRSTTWSSRRARSRCASTRAPTAPTATGASSSTRASTSGSRSPPRTRSSCRRSSTPTERACARSPPRPGRWPARSATAPITPPELSGGTFTVSNLGMYGVSDFQAVINAPQAAILAVGEIAERPVVRDGEITTAHADGRRRSPATTGSSTAPTGLSSWPGCGRCSKSRWGWRSSPAGGGWPRGSGP